jgi:hypothetical protein
VSLTVVRLNGGELVSEAEACLNGTLNMGICAKLINFAAHAWSIMFRLMVVEL